MASRKNTESAEDSLKGGSPEQAEVRGAAAGASRQQHTGGGNEGDTGSPAGSSDDPAKAALLAAVSTVGADAATIIPEGTEIQLLRRIATAASTILHDVMFFAPGDPVPLTEAEFLQLQPTGALAEARWDDLPEI